MMTRGELWVPGAGFPARVERLLNGASDADYAVSYVSEGGVELLLKALKRLLERKGRVRMLVSLDMNISSPAALRRLSRLGEHDGFELRYSVRNGGFGTLHAKFLVVRSGRARHVLIGSSNLTGGGYKSNAELNVLLADPAIVREAEKVFERLWGDESSLALSDPILTDYEKRFKKTAAAARALRENSSRLREEAAVCEWRSKMLADAGRFRRSSGYSLAVKERAGVVARIRKQLDAPRFRRLSEENWKAFYKEASLGRLVPIYRDNIYKRSERLLAVFRTLADERMSVEARWNRAVSSQAMKFVGSNILSKVMVAIDPVKYAVWNHPSEHGMRRYGYFPGKKSSPGKRYANICDFQRKLCRDSGIKDNAVLDFWLCQFYWDD